jgi:hypothetical protein
MKEFFALILAALLAFGSATPTFATHPPKSDAGIGACDPAGEAGVEGLGGSCLVGTIRKIDHRQGLLTLESPVGLFELAAAPAEIADLQEGDLIAVYLAEDAEEGGADGTPQMLI